MNMDKNKILLVAGSVASTFVASLVLFYLFIWWSIRSNKVQFFKEQSAKSLMQLTEVAQLIGKTINGQCVTRENLSSIGDKSNEQRLEVLSRLLTLSEAKTGMSAEGIGDLSNLPSLGEPRAAYVNRLARECSVFPIGQAATLLNCDGLMMTPRVAQGVATFSPDLRRFYVIDGHEVLFRPTTKCN
jgi:hypothetical protein